MFCLRLKATSFTFRVREAPLKLAPKLFGESWWYSQNSIGQDEETKNLKDKMSVRSYVHRATRNQKQNKQHIGEKIYCVDNQIGLFLTRTFFALRKRTAVQLLKKQNYTMTDISHYYLQLIYPQRRWCQKLKNRAVSILLLALPCPKSNFFSSKNPTFFPRIQKISENCNLNGATIGLCIGLWMVGHPRAKF